MRKSFWMISIGFGAVLLGILLYYFFQNQPDSRFPSGRFSASCLCYFTVLFGTGLLYQGVGESGWLHAGNASTAIVVALGLSMLTALLGYLVLFHANITLRLPVPGLALGIHGWGGRLVLLPFFLIFFLFSSLSWVAVFQDPRSPKGSKKKPRAVSGARLSVKEPKEITSEQSGSSARRDPS